MPNLKAATENISMLMPRIISVMVKDLRFNVYNANTSILSNIAPAIIISPIPIPRNTPPKMEISNLSFVIAYSGM